MQVVKFKLYDEVYEVSFRKDTHYNSIIGQYIKEKDIVEFYSNEKEFIENNVEILMYDPFAKKKLYLIDTCVSGYDTYRSGVFCAYTESDAKQESLRFSDDFIGGYSSLIGSAEENVGIGIVISDFREG